MQGISPNHYKIHLIPDLDKFTFKGNVEITIQVESSVQSICLNILDINISTCYLVKNDEHIACPFSHEQETEELRINLPGSFSGTIRIAIVYEGAINDLMAGFYRSKYIIDGKTKYIAVTQFEESDARRAFPCMDHPSKKAVFDITLDIEPDLTAISNGDLIQEEMLENGKKRVAFEPTPKMSTYLVFIGVRDFDIMVDTKDKRVRAVTLPGMKHYAEYGLEFGRNALAFSESYYGVDYPMTKMDLIPIPDFAFGAMENWGAITFRENLLLYYPGTTSKTGEERICEVIAHEIAHQWFGNLVTPEDWQYLWLNESFATYFGYGVVDHFHPEWKIWDQFLTGMTATAMSRDALLETFAIEIPGGEHVVINSSTAPIIYNKGGSVLRQIYGYIGEDNFQKGLQHYLRKHAYGCAASHHLWESFEEVSEKPINEMMQSWIKQPGFPVISVNREDDRLILNQKRFTYMPQATVQSDRNGSEQVWNIPIIIDFYDNNGISNTRIQEMSGKEISVAIPPQTETYKLNSGQTGFYRVKYEILNDLKNLGKKVHEKVIPAEDRWGIQNDLFHFCLSGDVTFDAYLDFIDFYKEETADLPILSIAENLSHAYRVLEKSQHNAINAFAKPWYERILDRIGYMPSESENHTTSILRDQLIWDAVRFGVEKAVSFTAEQFDILTRGHSIHPDIVKSIMLAGAWTGDNMTLKWFTELYVNSEIEHERMNILTAIGAFRKELDIKTVLEFVLETVPPRNNFIPVVSLAANPHSLPVLWQWYLSKLDTIEQQFHPMLYERVIGSVIPACGMIAEDDVKTFFRKYVKKTDKAADIIKLSLERLEINLRFRDNNR